jgi:hypothetical protein
VQAHDIDFSDWTLQQVDFTSMPQGEWESFDFKGASFWGCALPSYTSRADLERHGATVMEQLKGLPFLAIRAHMYKQAELNEIDHPTYEWYLANRGIRNLIAQSIHDFFIQVRTQQACAKAVQHTLPYLKHSAACSVEPQVLALHVMYRVVYKQSISSVIARVY